MPGKTAASILHEYNLKQTAGRIALIDVLLASDRPLSHKEIYNNLEGHFYDSVSVYRSLETFVNAGFVHKIEDANRTWLFALCTCSKTSHCHPHFFCRICGQSECLKDYLIPRLDDLNNDYIVEEQRYYLKGICSSCNESL